MLKSVRYEIEPLVEVPTFPRNMLPLSSNRKLSTFHTENQTKKVFGLRKPLRMWYALSTYTVTTWHLYETRRIRRTVVLHFQADNLIMFHQFLTALPIRQCHMSQPLPCHDQHLKNSVLSEHEQWLKAHERKSYDINFYRRYLRNSNCI